MSSVIKIENLYKEYRLGTIGYGTLREDMQSWWARLNGKPDPNSIIGHGVGQNVMSDHILALNNINLEVIQGERLGIIGNNGAGKTTLLKILSRIASPTKGSIKIKGRIASLIAVGTGFHGELTGRDNIYLNGSILGLRKFEIDQRFDEIVDFSGVEKFIDTPVKRYSSGMYIRLGFAVAAYLDPDVLIVDEVLAVGDVEFQKKCLGKMKVAASEGRTVLFVSHNMSSIAILCDRLLVLKNGTINFDGDVETGIHNYLSGVSGGLSAYVNTENAPSRVGPIEFSKILSIETLTADNKSVSQFEMDSSLRIRLSFELRENIRNLEIGISIFNSVNAKLQTFVSNWEGFKADFSKSIHKVICEIPSIQLFPGIYTLAPWIKMQNKSVDDQIPRAIQIRVIPGKQINNYQYFETYPNSGIYQRSNWFVEEEPL